MRAGALRGLAAGTAALAARAAVADPLPEPGFGLPRDASADGHLVDVLLRATLAAIAVVFAAVLAAMLWAVFRHGRSHPADPSPGTRRSVGAVLGAVGLFAAAVDGTLFVRTLSDLDERFWNHAAAERDPRAVRIEVNAHQWAWAARYPGPDGRFGTDDDVVALNDIRVPAGRPILLQLASTDVIHSFFLPHFRVKQDAVPGIVTRLRFEARATGEYEIACAQHCGPSHYKMRGVLTVLPEEAYRTWLAAAEADARRAFDPGDAGARWGWEWRNPP